jgi:hypothetical protein
MNQSDEYKDKCIKACAGLSEDVLDGGWTATGIIAYAKKLEDALTLLLKETELSGNGNAKDYGWPKALKAARDALGHNA